MSVFVYYLIHLLLPHHTHTHTPHHTHTHTPHHTHTHIHTYCKGMEVCSKHHSSSAEPWSAFPLYLQKTHHQVQIQLHLHHNPVERFVSSFNLFSPPSLPRWGRLRATMMPWPGLVEPFTECLGLGLLGSLAAGYLLDASFLLTLFFMVAHCAAWFTFDVILMRTIEVGVYWLQ